MILNQIRKLTYLEIITLSLLIIHFIYFIWIIAQRINFTYGISVVEGNVFYTALKLLSGSPLYETPDVFPVGTIGYTPVYPYLLAILISVFGKSLFWGRIISVLATLGTSILIYKIVKRQLGFSFAALFASLIYLMYFDLVRFSFDVVRPDALMVFFSIAALFYTSKGLEINKNLILAVIFSLLSIFTKQTGVFVIAAIVAHLFLYNRGIMYRYLLYTIIISAILVAYLQYASGGWFFFWAFKALASESLFLSKIHAMQVFLRTTGIIAASILFYLFYVFSTDREKVPQLWVFALLTSGAMGLLGLMKEAGTSNTLMPFAALMSILVGLTIDYLHQYMKNFEAGPKIWNTIIAVFIFQIFLIAYRPEIPNSKDYEINRNIENYVKNSDGQIYVGSQSAYAFLNDKNVSDDIAILRQMIAKGLWKPDRIVEDFENRRYSLVISRMRHETQHVKESILRNYDLIEVISNKGAELLYGVKVYKPKVEMEDSSVEN